jgi:hypothetical protein
MTDRGFWLAGLGFCGNVRRLMYQSLIWPLALRDETSGLRAPLDAEDLQRLPDPLIDGMRRNAELGSDFLGAQMLVDEEQAIELPGRQPRNPLLDRILPRGIAGIIGGVRHARRLLQS